MSDVEDLIEESSHMEAESVFFLLCKDFGILVVKDPATLRESEFQLVTVICGLVRRHDRRDFRYVEMADAHKLVVNLLLLSLKLNLIWKRLPLAASTDAEMLAERFQTML